MIGEGIEALQVSGPAFTVVDHGMDRGGAEIGAWLLLSRKDIPEWLIDQFVTAPSEVYTSTLLCCAVSARGSISLGIIGRESEESSAFRAFPFVRVKVWNEISSEWYKEARAARRIFLILYRDAFEAGYWALGRGNAKRALDKVDVAVVNVAYPAEPPRTSLGPNLY